MHFNVADLRNCNFYVFVFHSRKTHCTNLSFSPQTFQYDNNQLEAFGDTSTYHPRKNRFFQNLHNLTPASSANPTKALTLFAKSGGNTSLFNSNFGAFVILEKYLFCCLLNILSLFSFFLRSPTNLNTT